MDCLMCGNPNALLVFTEVVHCDCCSEPNELMYYACRNCGIICTVLDGELIDSSEELPLPFKTIMQELLDNAEYDLSDICTEKTPLEIMHKCIKCETLSYEIKPNLYHCPDCGFEWEIR